MCEYFSDLVYIPRFPELFLFWLFLYRRAACNYKWNRSRFNGPTEDVAVARKKQFSVLEFPRGSTQNRSAFPLLSSSFSFFFFFLCSSIYPLPTASTVLFFMLVPVSGKRKVSRSIRYSLCFIAE